MTEANNPLEEWDDDAIDLAITAMHDAQMLHTGLKFTHNAMIGVMATVPQMVSKRIPIGYAEFETNGGRKAMVAIIVGDEEVETAKQYLQGETD